MTEILKDENEGTMGPSELSAGLGAWLPIETAPKQGQGFLAASGGWITVCCWNKYRDDWCCSAPGYPPYPSDETPTHWMPLPDAPNAAVKPRRHGD